MNKDEQLEMLIKRNAREYDQRHNISTKEKGTVNLDTFDDISDPDDFLAVCYQIINSPPKNPPANNYKYLEKEFLEKQPYSSVKKIKSYALSFV